MLTENAGRYIQGAGAWLRSVAGNDPELCEIFANFAFDEVLSEHPLNDRTRRLAVLAALLGCGGVQLFGEETAAALSCGVSSYDIREAVYQAVAYLGMGRVYPFIGEMNSRFAAAGVALPLNDCRTVEYGDRVSAGEDAQVRIFGEGMRGFSRSGGDTMHINRWLSQNCFGDYYTRKNLTDGEREMLTFCYLAAQGGCEPQLISHAAANMRVGNDRYFLISVISQCLPYIGYPRSLNALRCVAEAAKKQ